jgi:hypothetical protein
VKSACGHLSLANKIALFCGKLGDGSLRSSAHTTSVNLIYTWMRSNSSFLQLMTQSVHQGKISSREELDGLMYFLFRLIEQDPQLKHNNDFKTLADECLAKQNIGPLASALRVHYTDYKDKMSHSLVLGKDNIAMDDIKNLLPGGRHDNDSENFREISIVPTPAELLCKLQTYIPSTFHPPSADKAISISPKEASRLEVTFIDRHFRLLREDMVGPLREELHKALNDDYTRLMRLHGRVYVCNVTTKPSPNIQIEVDMSKGLAERIKKLKPHERSTYWDNGQGRRCLSKQSLVILGRGDHIVALGVVVERDSAKMAKHTKLQVGIEFQRSSLDTVIPFLGTVGLPGAPHLADWLYSSSISYFNYEPVLKRLKKIPTVPFREELVLGLGDQLHSLPHARQPLSNSLRQKVESDPSQLAAVEAALRTRVALVQGPPGTGKTHVGVVIANAILASSPSTTILTMCYTNHALDNFLEALLDSGVHPDKITRIGSEAKVSDRLKQCCLSERSQGNFSRSETGLWRLNKTNLEAADKNLNENVDKLTHQTWGAKWWSTVAVFLLEGSNEHRQAWKQLTVPLPSGEDEFHMVGKNNQNIEADYLWRQWYAGKDAGVFKKPGSQFVGGIWSLANQKRLDLVSEWHKEWQKPLLCEITDLFKTLLDCDATQKGLRDSSRAKAATTARIIGCTTTSAAKNSRLLQEFSPDVVLIEEAGEILEAQVLATLTNNCQQLIMIGDHQQLRPKAENYELRKEARNGVDLDVSLFERLALTRPALETLNVQHRMAPCVSKYVRTLTYPRLQDHPSVSQREPLRGLKSSVVFLTHTYDEDQATDDDKIFSLSHTNKHEVDMAVAIAQYMLKQGYKCDQIGENEVFVCLLTCAIDYYF